MVSSANADEQSQRHMMHEISDKISKVTNQLTALGKSTARSGQGNINEADSGSRIITLAGENKGATMKTNLEEMMDTGGALYGDDERNLMGAYTNSNYQAINNSILVGGSYAAEDPGVHLVISDCVGEHGDGDQESHGKKDKKQKKAKKDKHEEKKEKKKKKGGSKGENHSEDDETSGDSE